jgi:hypothetical protein
MSTLGDAADVNPVIKFLPHMLHVCVRNLITGLISEASPRVNISSICKVGQKLGVSLPLSHVQHVWQELDYSIDICRVTKGRHIEHL